MGIIRRTRSVKALLKEFQQTKSAISTMELVERLNDQMNRSTVYRILERLEDDGILHSFPGRDGLAWYAPSDLEDHSHEHQKNTHPHFQCVECGMTECLPINIPIPEVAEHSIESASLLLVGKCPNCLTHN